MQLAVVVAHHSQSLGWISLFQHHHVYIYCKHDGPACPGGVLLPNVGMSDHTYLHHIASHYDTLEDVTVFLPDTASLRPKRRLFEKLLTELYQGNVNTMPTDVRWKAVDHFSIERYSPRHGSLSASPLCLSRDRPFLVWFYRHMRYGDTKIPLSNDISYKSMFCASKDRIWMHPRCFYQALEKELEQCTHSEVAHFMERSWSSILTPSKTISINVVPTWIKRILSHVV